MLPLVRDDAVLEGEHAQPSEGVEQFARAQKEIGIARAAKPFVADRKGFVEQQSVGRQRFRKPRQQRPVQVVHDDDGIERRRRKWPRIRLQIEGDKVHAADVLQ